MRISRKGSSTFSVIISDSQKCRNSSGEHCYSLRSRGPPTEAVDSASFNPDLACEVPDDSTNRIPVSMDKKNEKVGEEEHADDEREKEEDFQVSNDTDADDITDDRKAQTQAGSEKAKSQQEEKKEKSPRK